MMTKPIVKIMLIVLTGFMLVSCKEQQAASESQYAAVDELYGQVASAVGDEVIIAEIDHSRLAAAEEVVMPPARVIIFSDPAVNTPILEQSHMAGLDLPFRVLAFADGQKPAVIATNAAYLQQRHGLGSGPALEAYEQRIRAIVGDVPAESQITLNSDSMGKGDGIVTLNSVYGFDESIERLRSDIMKEGDTVWFGEIDYQAEAAELGVELPGLTLLLFGAPGPGGKAMAKHPRMGLDAFCQKILVYQAPGGAVMAYFNDMPTFAELHHGESSLPHKVIGRRMGATLSGAVEE